MFVFLTSRGIYPQSSSRNAWQNAPDTSWPLQKLRLRPLHSMAAKPKHWSYTTHRRSLHEAIRLFPMLHGYKSGSPKDRSAHVSLVVVQPLDSTSLPNCLVPRHSLIHSTLFANSHVHSHDLRVQAVDPAVDPLRCPKTSSLGSVTFTNVAITALCINTFTHLPAMVNEAILLFFGTLTSGFPSTSMSKAPIPSRSLDSISRLEALDACAPVPVLSSPGTAPGSCLACTNASCAATSIRGPADSSNTSEPCQQCFIKGLSSICTRECESRPFPCMLFVSSRGSESLHDSLRQAHLPVPARVASRTLVLMAHKPPAQTKPWTTSCFLAFVSLCAPAACRRPKMGSSVDDILPVQSPFFPSLGKLLVQALYAEQNCFSQLSDRASVPSSSQCFCAVSCQPIFQDGTSSAIPASAAHPQHQRWARTQCRLVTFLNRRHTSSQQTPHQLVRVLHKPFGLGVLSWLACHDSFLLSRQFQCSHQCLYCRLTICHKHRPLQTPRFQALDDDLGWGFRGSFLCDRSCSLSLPTLLLEA